MTWDKKLEEYKEIQHRREFLSKSMQTWGQIFIPLSTAIVSFFVAQFLMSNTTTLSTLNIWFLWVGWGSFLLAMVYWRSVVHHIDQQIVGMYPRMLELEKDLKFQIQASYYLRNLNPEAKKYLADLIKVPYEDLKNWDYRALKKHFLTNKLDSIYHNLLKVWDWFVLEENAPFTYKLSTIILGIRFVNYSVTSRGHRRQNVIITLLIVIWFVFLYRLDPLNGKFFLIALFIVYVFFRLISKLLQ